MCRYGEIGSELFFIRRGTVEIVTADGTAVNRLGATAFFGENSFFFAERRNASIRAVTHCDVFVLTAESWRELLVQYPAQEGRLRGVAARYRRQRSSRRATTVARRSGALTDADECGGSAGARTAAQRKSLRSGLSSRAVELGWTIEREEGDDDVRLSS